MHKTFCITAVTFFSLASGNALGAEPPIYRCAQANGTLLYSDSPCERGTVVDVHPGRADPHAADRLARARAELDRAADARRLVDQATAQREAAVTNLTIMKSNLYYTGHCVRIQEQRREHG